MARRLLIAWIATLIVAPNIALGGSQANPPTAATSEASSPPFPLDERLLFNVRWSAFHVGTMTLESFAEKTENGTLYHIVMTARSSKFFDGIYKVRSRIQSSYSAKRMSSVRYHDHSQEKRKVTDDLWEIDFEAAQAKRTKNGKVRVIPIASSHVYDPLAYLYRLRPLVSKTGEKITLVMVTSDGDVETEAEVVRRKRISTRLGKVQAFEVVPQPVDKMMFSKSGKMSLWIGTDDRRLPYRIEFDLPFGNLVAKLTAVEERNSDGPETPLRSRASPDNP